MRIRMFFLSSVAALCIAPAAHAAASFTTPVKLAGATSGSGPYGGEPSIAVSPKGVVMVAGPQEIPSGVNGTPGTGLWISHDDGTTFGPGKYIGSYLGGGDDDVIYDAGTWYEGDLEAAATEICKSTDTGMTWTGVGPFPDPSNCTTFNGGQAGFSDDRPWLTADPTDPNRVYLTYHEFVSAQPLAFYTADGGGDDFSNPCGSIVSDPAIEANVPTDITGGTLVARPVVDRQGNLYVLFVATTQAQNFAALTQGSPSGTFSQIYLAVSRDHCQSFTDYTVFDGSKLGTNTVQFGDIFNDLAIDGAGNLYVVGAGYIGTTSPNNTANVYLFSSTDHGQHWSKPVELDSPHYAHMMPAAVGGPQAGQLAIGYFRTLASGKTDPNDSTDTWTYSAAESNDASSASPTFAYSDVNPGYSYHNGEICNLGTLCGLVPGPSDRSLADFTSAALAPNGCPLFTFAGNPTGSPGKNTQTNTFNFVTRQTSGCFTSTPAGSGGPTVYAGGGHRKHKRHHKRKRHHRTRAKHHSRHRKHHSRHRRHHAGG